MMKKVLALVVALVLLVGCMSYAVAEDVEQGPMSSFLTDTINKSTSEWFSSATNRGFLTLFLYLDYISSTDQSVDEKIFYKPSFVGHEGLALVVCVPHHSDYIFIVYRPLDKKADYVVFEGVNENRMEQSVAQLCSSYYENNKDKLKELFDGIIALNEMN